MEAGLRGRTVPRRRRVGGLEWRPVRGRSVLKFAAHANRRSEPSLYGADSAEADLLVKALGGPGCHLETLGALS